MSYTVTFWTFAKKSNSTKQPTATGTDYICEVMDGSGIMNPTVKLHTSFHDPSLYNYSRISAWNRYYFVSNWRYDRGLWWADLTEDVLASWKTSIGNYSGYILRAASDSDGSIKDTFYPAKANPTHASKTISIGMSETLSGGSFVVGIISGDRNNMGSVGYYVFTPVQFDAFCLAVFNNTSDWMDTSNIQDISTELLKTLFNPFEYIVSCQWFPITVPTVPNSTISAVPLGWWDVPAFAKVLYTEYITNLSYSVTPDAHPQAATRGSYLNSGPYTSLTLMLQPFGTIPIDASLVAGATIDIYIYIDYISGIANLYVETGPGLASGTVLYTGSAQIGVPVQISGRQPNVASMISGGIATLMDTLPQKSGIWNDIKHVTTNLLGAPDISGTVSKVASAAESGFKRLTSLGSNGSRSQILEDAYLCQDYLLLVDEENSQFGRPLYKTKTISTLSGFIQVGDPDIEFAGMVSEISMVRNYLANGFFYE